MLLDREIFERKFFQCQALRATGNVSICPRFIRADVAESRTACALDLGVVTIGMLDVVVAVVPCLPIFVPRV